ncbi:YbhB/YbcL family Raf kinase inhibitor-like protein [Acidipropionibacterium timonense]|uniref:YbhB/YbcL family Raf kinase inhibitor-like protein n=1 Tax=Acidipropionibacterium timonense TaxID=2161818 RepID=UPI00102FF075|nr:YbhB/YbcL family Raf kinase inhibitor-like protein [Acidipropionibacterium timonense]
MELSSSIEGTSIPLVHAHPGAGGDNVLPALTWTPGPEGTRSYALTCYDPDAPTGSGFWHWIAVDIPADVTSIPEGGPLPAQAREFVNDYQEHGYGGPNPPAGPAHRYVFTVHAMPVAHLEVPDDAAHVQVRFVIHTTRLDHASVTGTFQQP